MRCCANHISDIAEKYHYNFQTNYRKLMTYELFVRNTIFANLMQIAVQINSFRSELSKLNLHQRI
jgi:hypothetical protein